MREEFDDLARALARGALTRRQALARFGKLTGGAVLASMGFGAARAGADRFEFNRDPSPNASNQAVCAQHRLPPGQCSTNVFCSLSCPEGIFGAAICFGRANGGGSFCGAVVVCEAATTCTSNAECGVGEVCATTCCAESQKCVPSCTTDRNAGRPVTPAFLAGAANGVPTTAG